MGGVTGGDDTIGAGAVTGVKDGDGTAVAATGIGAGVITGWPPVTLRQAANSIVNLLK